MENVTNIINDKKFSTNKVVLDNRGKVVISGVEKALSSNSECIVLRVCGVKLFLGGHNLHIDRLDVETGVLEAQGDFDSIKFGDAKAKGNLFKRMFK